MKNDYNINQINPVAPMSLQNNFSDLEKKPYPFKKSEGFKNVFKVVLNSQNAVVNNNTYVFNVDFNNVTGDVLRCGLASLISAGAITASTTFNLHLNPLVQSKSFDSRSRGITDMFFTGRPGIDYIYPVNQTDCNFEVSVNDIKKTTSLSMYFTDMTGTRIAATNTWQCVLFFYDPNV